MAVEQVTKTVAVLNISKVWCSLPAVGEWSDPWRCDQFRVSITVTRRADAANALEIKQNKGHLKDLI